MNSTIFCDNCGATNRIEARFCHACGQPLMTHLTTVTGLLTITHELKGRYRIIDKLGQGGFGAIYKVEDMLFHNAVRAAKEMGMRGLSPQETQKAIEAFKNEALLLADLSHPHLPRIHDHFEERGRWYLVMDYIDGETLATHLENVSDGKLPIAETVQIALQLCDVLGYLHHHQPPIIFRDLKPENVMITHDGNLYLIDFGIARFFKPGQSKDTMILGTPGYAAPEQYGRMQTTVRSDIYSLGATLYHLISGINPGLNPFLFQPLELDATVPGNIELEQLILQMLEIKAEKRPADIDNVAQELQHIQQLQQTARKTVSKPTIINMPPPPTIASTGPILLPGTETLQQSLVVSQQGDGQYTTIGDALREAEPHAFILVKPGVYAESLVLDKAVEIIGSGLKEQIIVQSENSHCVTMHTDQATLRGFTLRCQASQHAEQYYGVAIPHGQLLLEDCNITSNSASCVAISGATARPTLRYCTVYGSPAYGIAITDGAQATFEYCDIFENARSEVTIESGSNPTFRHCTIHHSQQHGVLAQNEAQGTFEDCDIYQHQASGIRVLESSNLLLLRCQIHHNQQYGLHSTDQAKGSIQDCEIYANTGDNVSITTASTPFFYLCKIHYGGQRGVSVREQGLGTFVYCQIYTNSSDNVSITTAGNPKLQSCTIRNSQQYGIHVYDGGRGTIEYCTITGNALQDITIAPGCNVIQRGNRNTLS